MALKNGCARVPVNMILVTSLWRLLLRDDWIQTSNVTVGFSFLMFFHMAVLFFLWLSYPQKKKSPNNKEKYKRRRLVMAVILGKNRKLLCSVIGGPAKHRRWKWISLEWHHLMSSSCFHLSACWNLCEHQNQSVMGCVCVCSGSEVFRGKAEALGSWSCSWNHSLLFLCQQFGGVCVGGQAGNWSNVSKSHGRERKVLFSLWCFDVVWDQFRMWTDNFCSFSLPN